MSESFSPTCVLHGKKHSEHNCLFCGLCFKDLTPETCAFLPDGKMEDVCVECAMGELARLPSEFHKLQSQISTLTTQLDKCRKALENPATKSAITFLEAYFAARPCDNEAVSHCVKCNLNYLLSEIALASTTLAELEAGKGREG